MLFRNKDKSNQTKPNQSNKPTNQNENDHANGKNYEDEGRKDGKQHPVASYSQEYLLGTGVCDLLCAH
jgi:hypothetical protein